MSGAQVSVDYSGLRGLVADLGAMSPAMRAELRRGFRAAGAHALQRARANASWSSRIPGAISVRPLTGARTAGVFLRVDANRAPHARPYEGISQRGGTRFFRHPVFGDEDTWVSQASRPYLAPAVQASGPEADAAVESAVRAAARAGRFTS